MLGLKQTLERIKMPTTRKLFGPIGVDFSLEEMHLVQLEKKGDDITLHATVSVPYTGTRDEFLTSPKDLKASWKKALKSGGFSGNKVVTVLPAGKVRVMSISYSHSAGMDVNQSIIKVLQDRLSSDLSEYVIDYLPVRGSEKDDNHLAIVAIVQRDIVLQYLDHLRHAGLNVQALEIGPSAIKRLVASMVGLDRSRNVLVINFGQKMSYLTILSGRRLMFDQEVEFGEQLILDKLASTLDMTIEESQNLIYRHGIESRTDKSEAIGQDDMDITRTLREIVTPLFMTLVEEINRVLIYTASETRGEPVSLIYLVGSIARWQGADSLLHSILNIDVETIPNPLNPFIKNSGEAEAESGSAQGAPELAIATGMALRWVINE